MSIIAKVNQSTDPYRNPAPYPEIQVTGPNSCYAAILMQDYASSASELTAITEYLHHSFTESAHTDVSTMLLGIAEVEMDHLRMLGETIVLLGGNPMFASGCPRDYWSGEDVYYGTALCDKLKGDLKAELGAIQQYEEHIAQINDPYVKAILARIALDEQWHVGLLKQALSQNCSGCYCPAQFC